MKAKARLTDRQYYKVKNEILGGFFPKVNQMEFYREIFPKGMLQTRPSKYAPVGGGATPDGIFDDQKGKANGVIYYDSIGSDGGWVVKRIDFFDSLDEIKGCKNNPNTYITPMSYIGHRRKKMNECDIYALAIDFDGVNEPAKLEFICNCFVKREPNGWWWWQSKLSTPPTFIVNSGHGLHLYWCFEEPIHLTRSVQKQLTQLKIALMYRYWSEDFTDLYKAIQYQPIHQTFRAVGTPSKLGARYPVTAFKVGGRTTPQKLADSLPKGNNAEELPKDWVFTTEPNLSALENAMKKYPNWEPNKGCKNTYTLSPRVFEWWYKKVWDKAKCGGRFFALESVGLYAVKCGIPHDEAIRYMKALFDHLSTIQDNTHKELEEKDWKDAIKVLKMHPSEVNINMDVLKHKTCIEIERNRRNHRPQAYHLEEARAIRDIRQKREGREDWRMGNGRPKGSANKEYQKLQVIIDYLKRNPFNTGTNVIARETGLSKHTVIKWKDKALAYIKENGGAYQMTLDDFLEQHQDC